MEPSSEQPECHTSSSVVEVVPLRFPCLRNRALGRRAPAEDVGEPRVVRAEIRAVRRGVALAQLCQRGVAVSVVENAFVAFVSAGYAAASARKNAERSTSS